MEYESTIKETDRMHDITCAYFASSEGLPLHVFNLWLHEYIEMHVN